MYNFLLKERRIVQKGGFGRKEQKIVQISLNGIEFSVDSFTDFGICACLLQNRHNLELCLDLGSSRLVGEAEQLVPEIAGITWSLVQTLGSSCLVGEVKQFFLFFLFY